MFYYKMDYLKHLDLLQTQEPAQPTFVLCKYGGGGGM